jgi:hypothetical protein
LQWATSHYVYLSQKHQMVIERFPNDWLIT